MPNSPNNHYSIKTKIEAANVAADESTSAGTFVDLATPGPSVTLVTGPVVVVYACSSMYGFSGGTGDIGIDVSGATTIAPTVNYRSASVADAGYGFSGSGILVITGLTPGTNTFTMKYRSTTGIHWYFRSMAVIST
jgi:hypothetical protein